jgi:hypothetical protein
MQEFVVPKSIPKIFPIKLNVAVSVQAIRGPEMLEVSRILDVRFL